MKKLLLTTLCACLLLSGCSTLPSTGNPELDAKNAAQLKLQRKETAHEVLRGVLRFFEPTRPLTLEESFYGVKPEPEKIVVVR